MRNGKLFSFIRIERSADYERMVRITVSKVGVGVEEGDSRVDFVSVGKIKLKEIHTFKHPSYWVTSLEIKLVVYHRT
jgi:hypothetical protein